MISDLISSVEKAMALDVGNRADVARNRPGDSVDQPLEVEAAAAAEIEEAPELDDGEAGEAEDWEKEETEKEAKYSRLLAVACKASTAAANRSSAGQEDQWHQ